MYIWYIWPGLYEISDIAQVKVMILLILSRILIDFYSDLSKSGSFTFIVECYKIYKHTTNILSLYTSLSFWCWLSMNLASAHWLINQPINQSKEESGLFVLSALLTQPSSWWAGMFSTFMVSLLFGLNLDVVVAMNIAGPTQQLTFTASSYCCPFMPLNLLLRKQRRPILQLEVIRAECS